MENNSHHLLENDAAPISPQVTEIVEYSSGSLPLVENINRPGNNNMVMSNQTNSSAVVNINNSRGISFGNVFNVGLSSRAIGLVAEPNVNNAVVAASRNSPYKKTPTIKDMLESSDPISSAFLDIVSEYFGLRWREVTILLEVNSLFVDRMYEDHNEKGGTKEVVFQVLTKYFKDNEDHATVGWLITFLWKHGFRSTVWSVKEPWKNLKALEKELEG